MEPGVSKEYVSALDLRCIFSPVQIQPGHWTSLNSVQQRIICAKPVLSLQRRTWVSHSFFFGWQEIVDALLVNRSGWRQKPKMELFFHLSVPFPSINHDCLAKPPPIFWGVWGGYSVVTTYTWNLSNLMKTLKTFQHLAHSLRLKIGFWQPAGIILWLWPGGTSTMLAGKMPGEVLLRARHL